MSKRLIYLLVGLAVVFFCGSLMIFLKSRGSVRRDNQQAVRVEQHDDTHQTVETIGVKLFLMTNRSQFLRPVHTTLVVPETRLQLYREFIDELVKGREGYDVPLPPGVTVRSIFMMPEDGLLVIDFDRSLISGFPSGTASELEFIYFFVDNLCFNFQEIKKVKFLISGNEYQVITGHIDIQQPFYPNFSYLVDKEL